MVPAKGAAQYHVSPAGNPAGDGSPDKPWDIRTAFQATEQIKPGSTVWLHHGVYGNGGPTVFNCKLNGSATAPIIVRQHPDARATINGGIQANGSFTVFWGFDITNTSHERTTAGINRPCGISLLGRGHRVVNLVIHNVGHPGVGFWTPESAAEDSELYGTLIYHNGLYDDSGKFTADGKPLVWQRGSGIYAQNRHGIRYLLDNIIFRNFNIGLKINTENGHIDGFHVEGNVLFDGVDWNLAAQGGVNPARGLKIINNYVYRRGTDHRRNITLGTRIAPHGDAAFEGNYVVGSSQIYQEGSVSLLNWRHLNVADNTIIGRQTLVSWLPHASPATVTWDRNTYHGANPNSAFLLKPPGSHATDLAAWTKTTGFDKSSRLETQMPAKSKVVIRPNKYEAGRAHIAVYNWEQKPAVPVNVAGLLNPGVSYVVRDAQNFFGPPVTEGVFDGSEILLPMHLSAAAAVVGDFHHSEYFDPSSHTPSDFGCFILLAHPAGSQNPLKAP